MPDESKIRCVYRIDGDESDAHRIAREVAVEQTVEVPESLITPEIERDIVGVIESIVPDHNDAGVAFLATISYREDLAGGHLTQLLNLVYGNSSINPRIRLVDCELPVSFLDHFAGPNFGIDGLQQLLGVADRPLVCSALKPRGLPNEHFANLARAFALGGGDLIKDDHNLVSCNFADFHDRVSRCQRAVDEANARTGRGCLYLPYISAAIEDVSRQIECATDAGVRGILISPTLFGLDVIRRIAQQHDLFIMAHPTLTGVFYANPTHGIAASLYLGTLLRLAGVDASVFTNFGGRFNLSREDCRAIADRCREPLGYLNRAWPTPAGGMRLDQLDDLAETYGEDTILLIGGALLERRPDLTSATHELLDRLRERFAERLTGPAREEPGASEEPDRSPASRHQRVFSSPPGVAYLPHQPDGFHWSGRAAREYKVEAGGGSFRDVKRHELIGTFGEQTAFDLRYFEIAPGGFTSREKHQHTHVVIGARGTGLLEVASRAPRSDDQPAETDPVSIEIRPLDIAYVPPNAVHQLRNVSRQEPFGFFCIVDHVRDRPVVV